MGDAKEEEKGKIRNSRRKKWLAQVVTLKPFSLGENGTSNMFDLLNDLCDEVYLHTDLASFCS